MKLSAPLLDKLIQARDMAGLLSVIFLGLVLCRLAGFRPLYKE
jgi:hypothetical protein